MATTNMLLFISSIVVFQAVVASAEDKNLTFILFAKNLPADQQDEAESKLDPYVKVYETSSANSELQVIGKTEEILGELNPEWVKSFWITHKPGTGQKLRFEVKDKDFLNQDDAVGGAEVDLDDYVSKGENITVDIQGASGSTLTMEKTQPIRFKLSASNIPKKDKPPALLQAFTTDQGESDPYVKCYFRRGIGGEDKKYASTAWLDNKVNAEWDEVVEFGNYQPGRDQYWRFKVKDSDLTSKDDDIGEVIIPVDQFVKENKPKILKLQSIEDGTDTGATLTVTPVV